MGRAEMTEEERVGMTGWGRAEMTGGERVGMTGWGVQYDNGGMPALISG